MSDQVGKHDATGPLARGADGRVDPNGYVRYAVQGRATVLLHAVLLVAWSLIWLLRGFGSPGSFVALGVIAALDIALVCTIRTSQWWAERRRRNAGRPPSWHATFHVLQARSQGIDVPNPIRSETRLAGRLADCGDHWTWAPARQARKNAAQPITLAHGWTPHVTQRIGSHGIATFDTPSQPGPRLDFWIGRRRDLQHHLANHPL